MLKKIHYAFFAGICAAAASVFGKLSGLPTLDNSFILRLLCFTLMIFLNGCVWTLFVKALHQSESSLLATVVSNASNFLFSTLMGYIVFRETTSMLWWIGLSFILFGLFLVMPRQVHESQKME
ncbi:hypothetical protein HHI36_020533 [Cryptolaemus montrouzieri]|uniref:Transmembrane protein 42 n=1 Tax=Cryptolaemus montrouzieri TaxID=559131 RepID=A0ABD2NB78_9CUCU